MCYLQLYYCRVQRPWGSVNNKCAYNLRLYIRNDDQDTNPTSDSLNSNIAAGIFVSIATVGDTCVVPSGFLRAIKFKWIDKDIDVSMHELQRW